MASAAGDRARSGVRQWVRKAGAGLRSATPYGIVAMLAASAVAPVAGVALGASGELTAVLSQLGGVGSNYLADCLLTTARQLRGQDPSAEQWRDAVGAELLARLTAGDERAAALRDEVGALLHAVGAVEVALRAADEQGREALAVAFGALGEDLGRLYLLATDAAHVLAGLQQQLAEQGRTQRQQTDLLRQSLVVTAQLHQAVLGRRTPPPATARAAAGPQTTSPYPGLASFEATDARYFHGRESVVAELLGRLSEQLVGGPPVVVVGVSGVGKSSLLRAGVLPAIANGGLAEDSAGWPVLVMTPGATPLAELTTRTAVLAGAAPAGVLTIPAAGDDDPAGSPGAFTIAAAAAADDDRPAGGGGAGRAFGELAARAGGSGRLVIVVDQFEELFTQCPDPAERVRFVETLAAAAPALVLIGVRADFYSRCTEIAALVPILDSGQVVLGPLRTDEVRRAVREPAAEAGLVLEPGLEELLLTDLGALTGPAGYDPGALPLLAHALRATWAGREGDTMTVAGYRRTGGIRHAVAESAERSYLALDPDDRRALRSALLGLVTVVDNLAVRRPAARAETDVAVLRPLIDARLVTAGQDVVEISHEALLTGWPRLAGWLTEAREEILLRQRLAQAATEWAAAGEDPDLLYRGARLVAAREWADGRGDLPAAQRSFLAAGATAAEAELLAQRRTSRRLRRLVAGLAAALLLAVGGAAVALQQRATAQQRGDEAVRRGNEATSRQYAAESRTDFFIDPADAVRKALAAWQTAHTVEARSALLSAGQASVTGQLGTELRSYTGAITPDGRLVAVARADGHLQLWDTSTLLPVGAPLTAPTSNLASMRFSPDGRYLATGAVAADGITLWAVPSGRLLRRLPGFGAVAWLPDSSAVLAPRFAGRDKYAIGAWNPADGRLTGSVATDLHGALSLSVSADGRYLALAAENGEIRRIADQRRTATLPGAMDVAFGGGTTLAVRTIDTVTSWNAATGRKLATLSGPDEGEKAGRMAVTPDGTVLVQGDRPRVIRALLLSGDGARPLLTGFHGSASDLNLSADGHLLVVAGTNSPPTLLRLGVDRLPHPHLVGALAFDPSGARLATGSGDPAIRLWDPATSNLTGTIRTGSADGPLGLAYGPDGSLAEAEVGAGVRVYGPDGRLRGHVTAGGEVGVDDPVFSPDGSLLAVVTAQQPDVAENRQDRPGYPDVVVYDSATLAVRAQLETPGHQTIGLTFTPDGSRLIAAANRNSPATIEATGAVQDGALFSWRTSDLAPLDRHDLPGVVVADVVASPDSRFVAVGAGTGQAEVFTADGLEPVRALGQHPFPVSALAYSPDGHLLATASDSVDDITRLWDTGSGDLVAELRGNGSAIEAVAFSPDGRTLATGSGDSTVALWHLDPDDAVRRLCAVAGPVARAEGVDVPGLCR